MAALCLRRTASRNDQASGPFDAKGRRLRTDRQTSSLRAPRFMDSRPIVYIFDPSGHCGPCWASNVDENRWQTPSRSGCSLEFHDHFHLDRRVARQASHTNGGARMSSGFTEHFHHEIGKSIHYKRLVAETFGGIDHAEHFDHTLDPIEAAERGADLCEHDETRLPCRLSALLHCEALAELAFAHPRRACGTTGIRACRSEPSSRSWRLETGTKPRQSLSASNEETIYETVLCVS